MTNTMTLNETIDAVWEARAVVSLRKDGTPTIRGNVGPQVLASLRMPEHREAIVGMLRGLGGARLEQLVCGNCDFAAAKGKRPTAFRTCSQHGATHHFPRRQA